MMKKLRKVYLTYYNLLIAQSLLQAHYQLLSINFLKKFVKLNVNTSTMIKTVKFEELHAKYVTVFLNTQTFKMI